MPLSGPYVVDEARSARELCLEPAVCEAIGRSMISGLNKSFRIGIEGMIGDDDWHQLLGNIYSGVIRCCEHIILAFVEGNILPCANVRTCDGLLRQRPLAGRGVYSKANVFLLSNFCRHSRYGQDMTILMHNAADNLCLKEMETRVQL